MGKRDHPGVMDSRLHLDPELAYLEADPSEHLLTPPSIPALPDAPAVGGHIDMGVTSQPRHSIGSSLPPWLDPTLSGPLFDRFSPDDDTEERLGQTMRLPSKLFPQDDRHPAPPGWGKNDAGAGLTKGDWQMGGKPSMSTSDRFDTPGTRDRAELTDRDNDSLQKRGEPAAPDPVGDALRGTGDQSPR
jgi:hypothetical protein